MPKTFLRKIFNCIIFVKHKNYIYVAPHENCYTDKYDLINCSSDNALCVVSHLLKEHNGRQIKIFLECHTDRFDEIYDYINKHNNSDVKIKLLMSSKLCKSKGKRLKNKIINSLYQYASKIWMSDTLFHNFGEKLKCQKVICANYSTPLKIGKLEKTDKQYRFLDYFIETSLLAGMVHSSEYKIDLGKIQVQGFPRNDNLLNSDKKEIVRQWIKEKTKCEFNMIFVYAPTYRDYSNAYSNGCVFGCDINPEKLESFLAKNKILVIFKMHPLQELSKIKVTDHILKYESTPFFSLYDLLSISDCLISDYSSVIHDYLITNKPIILNCFDEEKYDSTRGFAFQPVTIALPANECNDADSLLEEMNKVANNKIAMDQKYKITTALFHKYLDSGSTKRVADLIESLLK